MLQVQQYFKKATQLFITNSKVAVLNLKPPALCLPHSAPYSTSRRQAEDLSSPGTRPPCWIPDKGTLILSSRLQLNWSLKQSSYFLPLLVQAHINWNWSPSVPRVSFKSCWGKYVFPKTKIITNQSCLLFLRDSETQDAFACSYFYSTESIPQHLQCFQREEKLCAYVGGLPLCTPACRQTEGRAGLATDVRAAHRRGRAVHPSPKLHLYLCFWCVSTVLGCHIASGCTTGQYKEGYYASFSGETRGTQAAQPTQDYPAGQSQ